MRWGAQRTLVIIGVIGVLAFAGGAVRAQEPDPTPVPVDSVSDPAAVLDRAEEIMDRAEEILSVAENTANQSQLMLDFIQTVITVGGVVAALVGVLFTAAGFRTLREYRGELDEAREELATLQERLLGAADHADKAQQTLNEAHMAEMEEVRSRADRAIRALAQVHLGKEQFRENNIRGARRAYEQAYALDPDSATVNYFLGELYLVVREVPKAVECLERALEIQPDFALAQAALGFAWRLQAEEQVDPIARDSLFAEAEMLLTQALKVEPDLQDARGEPFYGTLGGLYRRQGRYGDAIRCYKYAEQVTPQHSYPVINLAMLYAITGSTEAAQQYFERAAKLARDKIEADPFAHWSYLDLAISLLANGEIAAALEQFDRAARYVPSRGPLDSALHSLETLRDAPVPPPGLEQAIERVKAARDQVLKKPGVE